MKKPKVSGYVDFFLLPVQKKNLNAYKRLAKKFAEMVGKYGALDYRECAGDDLRLNGAGSFGGIIKLKPGEILVASYVLYSSKKQRDRANKKLMSDPIMEKMMENKPAFDPKRLYFGGFKTFVTL